MEFFFSDENGISPEALIKVMPGTDILNSIAKKVLQASCDASFWKKPVKILEIGARTGEFSATLMPFFSGEKVAYTCTDVSAFFTDKTNSRFIDYPFVESAVLDIERDPGSQGYLSHSFDIIVAHNSVHRARNIGKVLKHIVKLLSPGGLLLMVEATVNTDLQKISVGLIEEGFTTFEDARAKMQLPLLDGDKWLEFLKSSGFDRRFTVLGRHSESVAQDMIIAQAPNMVKEISLAALSEFLQQKIPTYMIPSDYIAMNAIPLTPNGKLDRKSLPVPDEDHGGVKKAFMAPGTKTEFLLTRIWQAVLKLDQISIHDSFFDLGGDSLLATRIIAKIREKTGVAIPLRMLFESLSIRELAKRIANLQVEINEEQHLTSPLPKIIPDPENVNSPFPLSDVQYAYSVGRSGVYELGTVAAHCYFELDGVDLDLGLVNSAWQRLINHHDMMRVIFENNGQSQKILPDVPFYKINISDFSDLPQERCESALEKIRYEMSHQILPMDQWPLFEIRASRYGGKRVRIHISFDNITFDGWSMFHLLNEWSRLYKQPEATLPPIELSFRDYILAGEKLKESEIHKEDQDYWLNRLEELPPAPELPLVNTPEPGEHYRFSRFETILEPRVWKQLKKRAKRLEITPSGLLLTAFAEVINLWSTSPRFTINLTLFNRLPLHSQVNDIIGDFTSLTLLAIDCSCADSFEKRAKNLQQQLWKDLDHPYFSGVQVLRKLTKIKNNRRGAIMPIVFTSALGFNQPDEDPLGNNNLGKFIYGISQTPQVLLDHQVYESSGQLNLVWDTVKESFPDGLLDEMFDSYCLLLRRLAGDDKIWSEKSLVTIPDKQLAIRKLVNATESDLPKTTLHSLFQRQAVKHPEKVAVITPSLEMTYKELSVRSDTLGRLLRKKGVVPGSLVAVLMEKGWEQVVGVLGVLKSGAAYLPIDPDTPEERLEYILKNGRVEIVLTQSQFETEYGWPEYVQHFSVDNIDPDNKRDPLEPIQDPDDLAYVIYTSGSTGRPKGVMIDHQGAVNTIMDINERFSVGPADRVLALAGLNFDLSVYDLFGILAAGAAIVIPEPKRAKDPAHWIELMGMHNITIWNSVPQIMQMLIEYSSGMKKSLPQSLRLILMSGDWIPVSLPPSIKSLYHNAEIVSLGGATEASIWSILFPIKTMLPGWKSIPYGKPMANQKFYVLNRNMAHCPDWVPGDLYIAGAGLAKGYLNDKEKTNASFIKHPQTGECLYKTGDLGRFLPDGNIEFIGREDFQVKINGYRVELGEVESVLKQFPGVRDAVVDVGQGTRNTTMDLVGYVVLKNNTQFSHGDCKVFLKKKLLAYMVPLDYVILESMPLTSNGKIDRSALRKLEKNQPNDIPDKIAPRTELERSIADIISEVVGIERVGILDNFFDLGADSIQLVRIHTIINKRIKQTINIVDLFGHPTISSLAEYLSQSVGEAQVERPGNKRANKRKSHSRNRRLRRAGNKA
ncbi:amino acid adenylation domain-containing protein [Desulfobacter sp.]|uniref:amino acid adenylation domain-containing protein n=1 Tax=Desulfobacter sp. TaxID=2294 RepID=UPI003D0EC1BD